jgi:hypothetical protein
VRAVGDTAFAAFGDTELAVGDAALAVGDRDLSVLSGEEPRSSLLPLMDLAMLPSVLP